MNVSADTDADSGLIDRPGGETHRNERRAASIFLWLTTLFVLAAIYLYQIGDLLTFLLVMSASLFLGLFTFALMLTTQGPEPGTLSSSGAPEPDEDGHP